MAAEEPVRGPLDDVLRRAGATMVARDGRWVAAHFGSRAGEVAACRGAVGIADRSDRATFELRGPPEALDRVVEAVTHRPASRTDAVRSGHAWWCRVAPERIMLRCEPSHAADCRAALDAAAASEEAVAAADLTGDYAAIELIGPRVRQVLRAAGFNPLVADREGADTLVLLAEAGDTFELLSGPAVARDTWTRLQDAGRRLGATCVGMDALELLAAGDHLDAAVARPEAG